MSALNVAADVSTLKWTVSPTFTLIAVANPWMVESPAPLTSHCDDCVPVIWFSQTIGFGPHCAVRRVNANPITASTVAAASAAAKMREQSTTRRKEMRSIRGDSTRLAAMSTEFANQNSAGNKFDERQTS